MEVNIFLAPEFEIACDLLYIKPDELLQAFINNISLSYFSSSFILAGEDCGSPIASVDIKNDTKIIATDFIISYNSQCNDRLVPAKHIHKKYLTRLKDLHEHLKDENDLEKKRCHYLILYDEWHNALLNQISDEDAVIDIKTRT